MKKLFVNKNVVLICLGSFISSIGDNLYNIGLTLSLYALSGSVFAVAGMWLIRALIRIPGQFFSGIIADKFNRKKVSVLINLLSGIICFMFVFVNNENMFLAYIIIFLLQATSDVDNAASMAMIPEIVEKEALTSVNSLFSLIGTITLFISPALAGIIYMKYGVLTLYVLNSVSFILGGALFSMIKYSPSNKSNQKKEHKFTLFKFAKEGFEVTITNKLICTIIASMMIFAILGRFYEIYKVVIADRILYIGSVGIVYFSYAMALGSLIAPLLIKFLKHKACSDSKSLMLVSLLTGLGFMLFGVSSNVLIACFAVLIIGLFQTGMSVYINSIIQREVENQYLGRVFSLYKIATMLSAIIGILLAPSLLDWIGSKYAFGIFSMIGILSIGFMFIISKNRRKGQLEADEWMN